MTREEEISSLFPDFLRPLWRQVFGMADRLEEIRLRADKPVLLYTGDGEYFLSRDGQVIEDMRDACRMDGRELDAVLNHICRYSLYAYEEELRQGYLTVPGGHRVGLAGRVIPEGRTGVRNMKYISCMNIRISHEIIGAADPVMPYLYERGRFLSVLLISPPGCGKTTLLRDIVRQVSNGGRFGRGRTVGVVDERSEIAGSYMGLAQNDVGIRTDVLDACPKTAGMLMLLRSMSPEVIAVDELGEAEEAAAMNRAALSGSGLIATIHGEGLSDVRRKAFLKETLAKGLFERFVVLGREGGRCRVKEIYDGAFAPC